MEVNHQESQHHGQAEIRAVIVKKEELSDSEWEQTIAPADLRPNAIKKENCSSTWTEVFVLRDIESSERAGRFCRALRYQPRFVHTSNGTDLKTESVSEPTTDLNANDTNEEHVCKVCGAEYTCRAELKLHMEDHEGRVRYCCKICGKGFRSSTRLAEHEKDQACEGQEQMASGRADSSPEISRSVNRKTQTSSVPSKKHVCELCGVEYARKLNLIRHMRIHTGEAPYQCKICGKAFRRSDWLAGHMKRHEAKGQPLLAKRKKQYACSQCEKTYQSREALQRHLRTHTGERPYQCAICEKRFYNEGCLKIHLKCHSDDRPYTCSECGHSFKRSGILNKHMRIHTGEKPFSCSFCGKMFRYKYSVSVHLKNRYCHAHKRKQKVGCLFGMKPS